MSTPALPANLPSIASAKLPASYESAKTALAKCSRVDECATWAKKAEALASYAKQAGDDSLRKMADRIQVRAIERCGALLKQMAPKETPGRPSTNGGSAPTISRDRVAKEAGLSRDQRVTALRVASVPKAEFERLVESDDPPTVTEMAERGTKRVLMDLQGRDPAEFAVSTQAQGQLRRLAEFTDHAKPAVIVRGALPHEYQPMTQRAKQIAAWLEDLIERLKGATA